VLGTGTRARARTWASVCKCGCAHSVPIVAHPTLCVIKIFNKEKLVIGFKKLRDTNYPG